MRQEAVSIQRSAVSFNFFETFVNIFVASVVKKDLFNRKGRKEGAKVSKKLKLMAEC